jgi:toxin ParE1/3/4
MSPRFAFRPEARDELREAVLFYEKERPGLGAEFSAEVRTTLEALVLNPNSGPEFEAGTRRKLVPRFPYSVLKLGS